MAGRSDDWLRQGRHDLDHARRARGAGDHEWACFAAHQAAEKALKAVFQARGEDAWGHAVSGMLGALGVAEGDPLMVLGKALDKHYVLTRYPNGFTSGAPMDYYTDEEAAKAIGDAEAIIRYCEGLLARPRPNR